MSKVKKIILCFSSVVLLFCFSLTVFAEEILYINSSMAEPQINDELSFIEVYCTNPSNPSKLSSLFGLWVIQSPNDDQVPVLTFDSSNSRLVIYSGAVLYGYYSTITSDLSWQTLGGSGSSSNSLTFSVDSRYNIVTYIRIYGGIRNQTGLGKGNYVVNYGSDRTIYSMLQSIVAILRENTNNTQNIITGANQNSKDIQSNNDKNTQNIINNQNQLAEQEKTETQNSGNDSVNDVSSSVPDKSAGMLSALQSLSNAVSYTGTVAKWKFPQMYIPAISGVTDRINLNSEMEIDFTYWVNQIPQDIRTILTALATIGLVIFAFKELYGLISYVLTLKGGGNNE